MDRRFKKFLELVWTLVQVTSFIDRWSSFTPLQASHWQVNEIRLLEVLFVKKLLWVNWTCCTLLTIIVGFPRSTASLLFNMATGKTYLHDGMTLKIVFVQNFAGPLCDKQVIASALGQLRINYSGPAGEAESENASHFFSPKKGGSWSQAFHAWTYETGDECRSSWVQCFAKNFLARIAPYTLMSHTKMSIVFGRGRSTNYSAWKPAR